MKSTKKPTHFFEKNKTIDDPTDANDKIIAYYKILALIFLVLMKQKCCFCIKVRKFFPFKCEPVRFFCFVFFFFFFEIHRSRDSRHERKKNGMAQCHRRFQSWRVRLRSRVIHFVCLFVLFVCSVFHLRQNKRIDLDIRCAFKRRAVLFFFLWPTRKSRVMRKEKKRRIFLK